MTIPAELTTSASSLRMKQPKGRFFMTRIRQTYLRTAFVLTSLWLGLISAAEAQKVVTWNVEWFPGRKLSASAAESKAHMARAQEVLKKLDPDVFIAEEVRDWKAFAELVSVVPALKVNVVSAFRSSETGELWPQQVGIASKLPVRAAWSEAWLPTIPSLPRGFSLAVLEDPPTGKLLLVYGVHMKSNRGEAEANTRLRNESAAQLLVHVDEMERITFPKGQIRGIIVAGDFNTNHDKQFQDNVIETLTARGLFNTWSGVEPQKRLTWKGSGSFASTTFDYIFLKGLGQTNAVVSAAPEDASDHNPVVVQLP